MTAFRASYCCFAFQLWGLLALVTAAASLHDQSASLSKILVSYAEAMSMCSEQVWPSPGSALARWAGPLCTRASWRRPKTQQQPHLLQHQRPGRPSQHHHPGQPRLSVRNFGVDACEAFACGRSIQEYARHALVSCAIPPCAQRLCSILSCKRSAHAC